MYYAPHEDRVWSGKVEILWNVWFLLLFAGLTLGLGYSGSANAGHGGGLHIDAASWDGSTSTLTANGGADKPKRGGGDVFVFDADTDASLGQANLPNSGNWTFTGTVCADNIYVKQDNVQTDPFPVSGGCGGNQPPTADDDSYTTPQDTVLNVPAPGVLDGDIDPESDPLIAVNLDTTGTDGEVILQQDGSFTYTPSGTFTGDDTFTYQAQEDPNQGTEGKLSNIATVTVTVTPTGGGNSPVANDDSYPIDTLVIDRNGQADITAPGVLTNDTDSDGDPITAVADSSSTTAGGSYDLLADGSFTYVPPSTDFTGTDSFSYIATDGSSASNPAMVDLAVDTGLVVNQGQNQFAIMMNYELGMHCTGFEFAYCCVLPPYNSILAQVVKTDKGTNDQDFPVLLEGDPNIGKDAVLQRETVVRDAALDDNEQFKKYVMRYWHEAQPRNDGRGKAQTSTLISAVELNSMLMWNTVYDKTTDTSGPLDTGEYNNATNVPIGDGTPDVGGYANGWLNHLYLYVDGHPNLEGRGATGQEADKIRLGVDVPIPTDCGPSLQPMGPVTTDPADPNNTIPNDCAGFANGNVLAFSTDSGTIVYTQMKVLEDLPVYLTSPRIWEALGLPLTPFEDSIDFFGDPGLVDEDSIRPYVAMKAQLHNYAPGEPGGVGTPVMDGGNPVIGFGTAPIDIPNCERCHSVESPTIETSPNAANLNYEMAETNTVLEKNFWDAYYGIDTFAGDSDWYSRLKAAALSMLTIHDEKNGTEFTTGGDGVVNGSYPNCTIEDNNCGPLPQNTRLGHESVICQKCHADNVIAVVKSADGVNGLIPPLSEALHNNHRNVTEDNGPIVFNDGLGRDGGCQGCHPAHRSDGDMAGYPIDEEGNNFYREGNPDLTVEADNRLANGGCFVGRDVHSNVMKDVDGAETPEHLNAVGQYLADNVFRNQSQIAGDGGPDVRGIWCTNCHTQLSQEIWKAEDCNDLINGDCLVNPRAAESLEDLASFIPGADEAQLISWLDPKTTNSTDDTHRVWDPTQEDALLAVIEVGDDGPVSLPDDDLTTNVNVLSFCTTQDCVDLINNNKADEDQWRYPESGAVDGQKGFVDSANNTGVAVPFNVATDGREHWLSPGEPHCGDCHAAPYTEQSGNNNPYAPFNYPAKASLMRYSRGHQDITCQGCHESTHGLYPVTPTIDTTSYAQAANLNADDSHGPLKCGTCHEVNSNGIPTWMQGVKYNGKRIRTFDDAVSWAHTYTDEASVLASGSTCENCHGDRSSKISETNGKWLRHTHVDRVARGLQDKAEIEQIGWVAGDPDPDGIPNSGDERTAAQISDSVCTACHQLQGGPDQGFLALVDCGNVTWKQHLTDGRIAEKVWSFVTDERVNPGTPGDTCGW